MTKAEFEQLKRDARHLAQDIGIRPAARAMGLPEGRLLKWSHRDKWNIFLIRPHTLGPVSSESRGTIDTIEIKRQLLSKYSDRTRLGLARSACTASETLAERDGDSLLKPATSISAEQWSKVADRTHGWTAERAQATTVNIANLVMPTEEERAARERAHDRLDAIAARLRETSDA